MTKHPPIIAFGYRAQSGKSTAAIQFHACSLGMCRIHSFAAPIKQIVHDVLKVPLRLDFKHETFQGRTGRKLYQDVGDYVRSRFGNTAFVDVMEWNLVHANKLPIIIDDVRFMVEAAWIKSKGGLLVKVERPDLTSNDPHASEREGENIKWDMTLVNSGTQAELLALVNDLYREMML